jgi:CHAT domain
VTGPRRGAGGRVGTEDQLQLLLDAAVSASASAPGSREGKALTALLDQIQAPLQVRARVSEGLRALGQEPHREGLPFAVRRRDGRRPPGANAVRVSFWRDAGQVHAAAITETSTVSERVVKVDPTLVTALVQRMTDPPLESVEKLSDMLSRLLVPHEFHPVMQGPLVFEVDRAMAEVHWEMCGSLRDDAEGGEPIGVRAPIARQLRTTYSPVPMRDPTPGRPVRVLIVGDPGDPEQGADLPGARREALRVHALFERFAESCDLEVETRIGAPTVAREGRLAEIAPADRLEVLYLLMQGRFDLVHYSGHGDFDPERPDRVGWLFSDGLITSGELQRLVEAPRLVVANACLSARTSQARERGKGVEQAGTEAGLLPSLADEFFRLGTRNYIGTAWPVNDLGAELFATTFYEALFDGKRVGEAVLAARRAVWDERSLYGALWGAFQHYGDPLSTSPLADVLQPGGRP